MRKAIFLLALLTVFYGTGAAFERDFIAGIFNGGSESQDNYSDGSIVQNNLQSILDSSPFVLQSGTTEVVTGNIAPAESGEDTLVTLEGGWQIVDSQTYVIRKNVSFYNPETQKEEVHVVGFDLTVNMDSGREFLIPPVPPDYADPNIATDSVNPVYMGPGDSPWWTISNVILPEGLAVDYQSEIKDPDVKYQKHDYLAEIQYHYTNMDRPAPIIKVKLFGHEMNRVTMQTRNDAGTESSERILGVLGKIGYNLFNAQIEMQLMCNNEDDPFGTLYDELVPRQEQEVRLFYYWHNVMESGYLYTITWDPAGWQKSGEDGEVILYSGSAEEYVDLGWYRVATPALYARVKHPDFSKTFQAKYFTYDNLADFTGTIVVEVVDPDGSPVSGMDVEFWGGQNLGGGVKKETDENGEAELLFPAGTLSEDFLALTMTVFPNINLSWNLTQVIDNPARIVKDHRTPLFISPSVYINSGYPSDRELRGVNLEVYDYNNPSSVVDQVSFPGVRRAASHKQFGDYSDREVAIMGKHRAYIEIKPAELASRRLAVRAVMTDSDDGRRERKVILGSAADPGGEPDGQTYKPHELYESKKNFKFIFLPLQVGAWEKGTISYSADVISQQEDYIRQIFPGNISFNKGLPYRIKRESGWLWGKESHGSYLRRIFRNLNRLQKMDMAAGADLVIGMVPPGFIGASGLQDAGTYGLNWEFLGAAHGAVLIDPKSVLPHHTLHEFIHTLGFKDVYPSGITGWRPMSANGHDGLMPTNNIQQYSTVFYEYFEPLSEAIMYDYARYPWPTDSEYTALLEYATRQVSGGSSGNWAEIQEEESAEETTEVLLISGEALDPSWSSVKELVLDPVIPYKGKVERGGDPDSNPYVVQLVDSAGNVLEQGFFDHFEYDERRTAYFLVSLPRHANMAAIEIGTHSGGQLQSLWQRFDYDGTAPGVVLTGPSVGSLTGEFDITWEAGHSEDAPLCSTLLASADNGLSWQTLVLDLVHPGPGEYSYTVNAADLPAGLNYSFKVIVSDGLRYAEAVSASGYVVEGYIDNPALFLPRQEIAVNVSEDTKYEVAALLVMENQGRQELLVEFDMPDLPDWIDPALAERKLRIQSGQRHVEYIFLNLPEKAQEEGLSTDLALSTNDPDNLQAVVTLHVNYSGETPVPELAALLTEPAALDGGSWPLQTPLIITAFAESARKGLDGYITIEKSADAEVIVENEPLDPDPHRPGAYFFHWNPGDEEVEAGEYGAIIHFTDPETGQGRSSQEYDLVFTLYQPNSVPVFAEPLTYENDLGTLKVGETLVIPYELTDDDELQISISGYLPEEGLEIFEGDNNTGELRWTANETGDFAIYMTAEDPQQGAAERLFRLKVEENLVDLDMMVFLDYTLPPSGINPGSVTPEMPRQTVNAFTPIPVTATPAPGYEFVRWYATPTGNVTVTDENAPETTVILTGNALVRAVFTASAGSQPLGDLAIGDRLTDTSWQWEHRLGANYSDLDRAGNQVPAGVSKPVTWIVVAKDHYNVAGGASHVTLIAEDLIGRHPFDDSTTRGEKWEFGSNHWGNSGLPNAAYGLRPFLNSINKAERAYSGNGFYHAFSDSFKRGVLQTVVPNALWEEGEAYNTQDYVFAPTSTELGLGSANEVGSVFAYFESSTGRQSKLEASLPGVESSGLQGIEYDWYWTRQADSSSEYYVNVVSVSGISGGTQPPTYSLGIRPVVNLSADMPVSRAVNNNGIYEITGGPGEGLLSDGDVNGDGQVNVGDAILILRHIVGLIDLEAEYGPEALARAKVSGGETLSVTDAILVLRRIVGLA